MLKIALVIVTLLFSIKSYAKTEFFGIDNVISFKPGTGQAIGQDSAHFPKNIFGMPLKTATSTEPAASENDILSIGKGGEIVVGFKDKILMNVSGPDFIIYENPMMNGATEQIFAEPAIISVSQDGFNFFEFKYNPKTFEGLAGKTPTTCNGNDYNPENNGGDAFDLDEIGLDFITHIKIKDAYYLLDSLDENSKYYSPPFLVSGFDLDAIVGINAISKSLEIKEDNVSQLTISINNGLITINSKMIDYKVFKIYNLLGELLDNGDIKYNSIYINVQTHGLYYLVLNSEYNQIVTRHIIL